MYAYTTFAGIRPFELFGIASRVLDTPMRECLHGGGVERGHGFRGPRTDERHYLRPSYPCIAWGALKNDGGVFHRQDQG